MAGYWEKLRRLLSGKPKRSVPQVDVPEGNRGIAMRSRKKPDLDRYRQRVQEGKEKISEGEVEDFLYNETPLFVTSSNVNLAQYFAETQQMLVEFKDGAYMYDNISIQEAVSFATAQSKGSWVWDRLRVRGSATAHRKSYRRIG
jgi:hypothetical protein